MKVSASTGHRSVGGAARRSEPARRRLSPAMKSSTSCSPPCGPPAADADRLRGNRDGKAWSPRRGAWEVLWHACVLPCAGPAFRGGNTWFRPALRAGRLQHTNSRKMFSIKHLLLRTTQSGSTLLHLVSAAYDSIRISGTAQADATDTKPSGLSSKRSQRAGAPSATGRVSVQVPNAVLCC